VHDRELERNKGQRFLLQALAMLRSREPELRMRLVLVGAGSDENALRRLTDSLGLTDCVAFLGARDDVAEVVVASDLFVLPSLNEGLSQALLETMALGIPVVATDVGGTSMCWSPAGPAGAYRPLSRRRWLTQSIRRSLTGAPRRSTQTPRVWSRRNSTSSLHLARLQALYAGVASG